MEEDNSLHIPRLTVYEAPSRSYPALFELRKIVEEKYKMEKPYFHRNIHYDIKKIRDSKEEEHLLAMKIVEYVKKIYETHDIDHYVRPIDGAVEYSWYHGKLPKSKMPFAIHEDDFGGVPFTVTTCIFYLEKTLKGGELEIYRPGSWSNLWSNKLVKTINVSPSSSKKVKIVLIEGNILHNIGEIESDGDRHAVVVQFRVVRQRGGGKKEGDEDGCHIA